MNIELFKLSLQHLQPSDWSPFEELCSSFLSTEFSDLRTMASPSGDGGRDSELFNAAGKPFVAFQYSVTTDWKTKIKKTIKRIEAEFPTVRFLIYMSNQPIGGQADDLKNDMLNKGYGLDIRDRNWFIERAASNGIRENAATILINKIGRPYLQGENVITKQYSPLTTNEAKAALVYLGLQLQDDISEKGLTKVSFDALVRATLRHTTSEIRMPRHAIYETISKMLPAAEKSQLVGYIDSALNRLTKKYIRHWKKEDEYCLAHEESQRIQIRLAEMTNQETEFRATVLSQCQAYLSIDDGYDDADLDDMQVRIPRIIEAFLLRQGEGFVSAVLANTLNRISYKELIDVIVADISDDRPETKLISKYPIILADIVQAIISQGDTSTRSYLRRLSNSYTLLSFLNQTPDVQSATLKLFSHGTIWLDTSFILPLIAEQLLEEESDRKYTGVLKTCTAMGVEFKVTTGVIQEVNSHMNNALSCSHYVIGGWKGRIPFLYHQYLQTGKPASGFSQWIDHFRGNERPDDDLAQYLSEVLDIKLQNLQQELGNVDQDLKWAADRLWSDAHKKRRRNNDQFDEETTRILIQHDIETYLGVVALRKTEQKNELGYKHWLLTFDKNAWVIRDALREEFKKATPCSPLLSISFLINSLSFGPARTRITEQNKLSLPLLLDVEMTESMPHDILDIADSVRKLNEGLPEYVIRRKVRDAIDKARRRKGCLHPDMIPDEVD